MAEPIAGTARAAKLDVVRVADRTFALLGGNFLRFAVFAFALSLFPMMVVQTVLIRLTMEPVVDVIGIAGMQAYMRITIALSQIPAFAGFGAIFLGGVTWLEGRRTGFGSSFTRGLTAYGPLLLVNIAAFAALGVGLLLLIVPGAFLATIIVVAGPVMVIERMGLLDSFRRSAHLTQGNRWRILMIFIICSIADWAYGQASGFVTRSIRAALGEPEISVQVYVSIVIGTVFGTIKLMAIGAGLAALYTELRILKDGGPREELGKVFD